MRKLITPVLLALGLPLLAVLMGSYYGGLVAQLTALGLATATLAFVWGYAGILTLGHAVSFAIGAYSYAWFSLNVDGAGHILGILVGVLLSSLLSAVVGFVGLRGRVDDVSFGLFTLVILFAAGQFAIAWSGVTGGFNGLSGVPRLSLFGWQLDPTVSRLILTLAAVAGVLVLQRVLQGPFGGVLNLLRDSSIRAASFGYNVPAIRILTFTAAGGVAAFAGALYVGQVRFVSPTVVGMSMAVGFVVWALIGGRSSIYGSFIAAIVIGLITNVLSDKLLNVWMLLMGMLFILLVLFAPDGFVALIRRWLPDKYSGPVPVTLTITPPGQDRDEPQAFIAETVSVRFGNFNAVTDAAVTADVGEIHCLIGPNGAGKSTFLNAVSGIVPSAKGAWSYAGEELSGLMPWHIARQGVGRKYQKPSLALDLSVAQNLALSTWGPQGRSWSLLFEDWEAEISPDAEKFAQEAGLMELSELRARELSHGQRQSLELAMVLASDPQVLLLDEPAAGMTKAEAGKFGEQLRQICTDRNIPALMVEHDMNLIRTLSDRVTVLVDGKVLMTGTAHEVEEDPQVQAVYLGTPVEGGTR